MRPMNRSMQSESRRRERGVAMLFALLALLLLSTIAIALTYATSTESGVNWNYRQESIAYFAARGGVEELRDRLSTASTVTGPITPPAGLPGAGTGNVLYLINQGADPTTVKPWVASTNSSPNPYMDDELCHDGYTINSWPSAVPGPGVRCADLPSGSAWYQTATSNIQWNGTAAAVPYKWVRLAMKQNNTVEFGDPAQGGTQNIYYVNSSSAVATASQPVCYDGVSERVPPAGTTNCPAWAHIIPQVYANPVYTITAMGVSSSGARKVIQAEIALPPQPPFPYGLFSTGNTCGSMNFSGNGQTDSYNSAVGAYGGSNVSSTGGDIGSFGGISLGGNATVGGIAGVIGAPPYTATVGACPGSGVTTSGGGTSFVSSCPVGTPGYPCPAVLPGGLIFSTPPAPSPTPPTTTTTYSKDKTLPPGMYGNIAVSGKMTLTLSPGVYNINSLSGTGQANIVVSPVGQVVLNIGGAGGTAFNWAGQSITNGSNIPYDFLINYAGTDTINLDGQNASYMTVNAPNATINVGGQGDTYGAILGQTINYTGNGKFHYDKNSALNPQNNQNYSMLSVRELSY